MSQCTGKIGLSISGSTFQDDVVSFLDILACGKTKDLSLIKFAVFMVFDTFNRSVWCSEMSVFDIPGKFVCLTSVPFRVYE